MNLFIETLFDFPSYFLLIICFNQVNYIALHLLFPVSYLLRSEFCLRRFCTSILRNFCRSHGRPCVCVHACVYVFGQHTNN